MRIFRKVFGVLKIIIRALMVIAVALLAAYNVHMLVQRYGYHNGMPTVFGYASAVVVSGSMEPEISIGDLIIVKSQDTYGENDVITFYDSSTGTYVTHRIVLAENGSYATKGDANNAEDSFSVPNSAVVGKVVIVVRGAGNVITFFQSPLGLLAVLGGGVVLWLVTGAVSAALDKGQKGKKDEQEED